MDVTIHGSVLHQALELARRCVKKKSDFHIITCARFFCRDGALWLHTTNLENSIMVRVEAEIADEGDSDYGICVDMEVMHEYAKILKESAIRLRSVRGNKLECTVDKSVSTFKGFAGLGFPAWTPVESEGFTIPTTQLLRAIELVSFSAAKSDSEDGKPLSAVRFHLEGAQFICDATDRSRLSTLARLVDTSNTGVFNSLVPASSAELLRVILRGSEDVGVRQDDARIQFEFFVDGGLVVSMISQVNTGAFPNVEGFSPLAGGLEAWVDAADLRSALSMAGAFSDRFTIGRDGPSVLISSTGDYGGAEVHMDATYVNGDSGSQMFQHSYFFDFAKQAGKGEIVIVMSGGHGPCELGITEENNQGGKYRHVMMPMTV